jgi:hypothetical protein
MQLHFEFNITLGGKNNEEAHRTAAGSCYGSVFGRLRQDSCAH